MCRSTGTIKHPNLPDGAGNEWRRMEAFMMALMARWTTIV
jgi:hypothetical protein